MTLLGVAGGVLLLIGLLVPPVAVLLASHMLVGILLVHGANGWYVVGPGQGGAEFNVLLIAGLLALVFAGSGPPLFSRVIQKQIARLCGGRTFPITEA